MLAFYSMAVLTSWRGRHLFSEAPQRVAARATVLTRCLLDAY